MRRNPFVFQRPVIEPDTAFFRNELAVNSIVNGLLLGKYYTLLGPRFSGVSSMIWDILHTARDKEKHCHFLYFDLQRLDLARDSISLFERIVDIGRGWSSETTQSPSDVTSCHHFHEALVTIVKGKPARLIVAFDDLDSESLPPDYVKSLVRCARALYNRRLTDPEFYKISVLIGGSHSPYELSTGSGSPFNIAEKVWLRDLEPCEVAQLVQRGEQLSGVRFEDPAVQRLVAATEGDKYFVQRICHLCVQEARHASKDVVTEAMVSTAIDQLVSMNYREDTCFTSLVRSLKREPDLSAILVDLIEGKKVIVSECQANASQVQLTGVVRIDGGRYQFRNEVYQRFLDQRRDMIKDGWRLHAQAKKLADLHDVTLGLASVLDPDAALEEAAWVVLRASAADTVMVYHFETTSNVFRLRAVASREDLHTVDAVLQRDEPAREVLASHGAVVLHDWENCVECGVVNKPCTCIWLPLIIGNEVLGTLFIAFASHHDFSDRSEIMAAEIMASHLAIVVTRTELLHRLETDMATLASLYQVSTKLRTSLHLRDVLEVITASLYEMYDLATCTVGLLDEVEERLDFVAHRGLPQPTTRFVTDLPQDLWHRARQEGQRTFVEDVPAYPELAQQLERQDLRSFAILPLQGKRRFLGILTMSSLERLNLGERDWNLITALADQAAVAIENAQLFQEVSQARKALDDSLKILTHQLRAEPAFVTNTIDTLYAGKLGDLNEKQRNRLVKARRRLDEHHRLIDNINIYGRLKGGKLVRRQQSVQLAQLMQRIITSYRGEAKRRGLVLRTRGLRTLPVIDADEGMVEIVVANLLDNAIKFTPHGGQVVVTGSVAGQGVRIVVDDSGPGIPHEERQKVFEEYYQVGSNPTLADRGAGLGLYIAQRFVEMHNGRIAVLDKQGTGTRIEIVLPGTAPDL